MVMGMEKAILAGQGGIPPYPPKPPTSTYRRTGTLGRSLTTWHSRDANALARVEEHMNSVVGYIGTRVVYAPYVIDRYRQAWMHRGRWYKLQDVIMGLRARIVKAFREGYRKGLGV
jgi:hypothetical protein